MYIIEYQWRDEKKWNIAQGSKDIRGTIKEARRIVNDFAYMSRIKYKGKVIAQYCLADTGFPMRMKD